MVYDLIIRNGTIVDGLGGKPYVGDVAVVGGAIAALGSIDGDATREIDATACSSRPASSTCTPITTGRPSGRTA
jgi:N-acyl-D-aspartate/D-glutamate deacylase